MLGRWGEVGGEQAGQVLFKKCIFLELHIYNPYIYNLSI